MSPWKNFRYRLEAIGCSLLASGIPRLSRTSCLRLAGFLGSLAFRLDRRGRRVALENLQCAFGERFTPAEAAAVVEASYRNFLSTMLDLFWCGQLTSESFHQWATLEGFEVIRDQATREKRGMVLMSVHQGNWELGSIAVGWHNFHNTTLAENFKNPRLTEIFSRAREISGHKIIPQENSILRLLKATKRGGSIAALVDLSLPPTQAATVIEGFGLKMSVPLLPAVLGQRANALLVPIETRPAPGGRWRVIAHPPVQWPEGASLAQITQQCWNAFEPLLRARPELYLWAYKHFRYRPKGTERNYPAYANESGKFEKLMKAHPLEPPVSAPAREI